MTQQGLPLEPEDPDPPAPEDRIVVIGWPDGSTLAHPFPLPVEGPDDDPEDAEAWVVRMAATMSPERRATARWALAPAPPRFASVTLPTESWSVPTADSA